LCRPGPRAGANAANFSSHKPEEVNINMAKTATMLRPLGDRIVIKPLEQEETTRGGVILPDTAKEKPSRGKVIAVGSGRTLDNGKKVAIDVKVDQTVLYGKYSGTEIKLDGEEYVILQEREILGVFN
jgi:chaperonin GroES